ncbi:hypothetical protein ABS71_15815 [bacterium SCN 62-11]|nr:filamentous hemagglutinin N-terminal domain-containing protein [Candidatus Eremiobacteraeota bacterium]ODT62373.1 MAG: hypothetical protein ABS71_15815 [bacterium SCN 62-11]
MKAKTLLTALLAGQIAWALPENGQVIQGNVQIGNPQGNILQILQSSPSGIINWGSFNIDRNQLVQFLQPGASSALLNRVIGQDPSQILGQIQANGRIFLVNPNGILFGPGSSVNAGSFLATTLSMSDEDFLAGRYHLKSDPSSPLRGVTNQGEIKVTEGGFIALVSPLVHNQGLLVAQQGQIVLGATTQATLTVDARGLLQVSIPNGFQSHDQAPGAAGTVLLTPGQMSETLAALVSTPANRGERIVETTQGIQLVGGEGLLVNEGSLRVDAPQGTAGSIRLDSSQATVNTPGSLLSASSQFGNGGEILVLSAGTTRQLGDLKASSAAAGNGGFIEVSGNRLSLSQRPDLSAPQGKAGTLLLDPTVLHISNNPSTLTLPVDAGDGGADENVNAADLDTGGTVMLQATQDVIVDAGTVVTLNNPTDLQIDAQNRDFLMETGSSFVGNNPGASLTVTAGRHANLTDVRLNTVSVTAGGNITLNTGGYGAAGSPTQLLLSGGNLTAAAGAQVDLFGSTIDFQALGTNGITAEAGSRLRANGPATMSLISSNGEVNLREATLEAPQSGSNITVSANQQLTMGSSLAPTTNLHSDTFVQFNDSTIGVTGPLTTLNVTANQGIPFFSGATTNILGSAANVTLTSQGDAGIFDNHHLNLNNAAANLTIESPAGFFLSPGASILGQGALNVTIHSNGPGANFLMGNNALISAPGASRLEVNATNLASFRDGRIDLPNAASNVSLSSGDLLAVGSVQAPRTNLHSNTFVQFNNSTIGVAGQATTLNVTANQGIPFVGDGATTILGNTANVTFTSQGDAGMFDNHRLSLNNSQANVTITAPNGFFMNPGASIVGQGALNLTISSPNGSILMYPNTLISAPGPSRIGMTANNAVSFFGGSIQLPHAASNISLQALNGVTRVNQITTGGSLNLQSSVGNVRILDHIEGNDVKIQAAGNLVADGPQVTPYIIAHNSLDLTASSISGPLNLPEVGLVSAFPLATDGSAVVRIQVTGTNQSSLGNRAANLYYYFPSSQDTQVTANNGDVLLYRQPGPPTANSNAGTVTTRDDLTPAQSAEITQQSAIVQIQLSNLYSLNDLPSSSSVLMLSYDNTGLTHFSPVPLSSPLVELVVLSPEAAAKHQSVSENQANSMILAGNDEDEELRYWRRLIEGFIIWED